MMSDEKIAFDSKTCRTFVRKEEQLKLPMKHRWAQQFYPLSFWAFFFLQINKNEQIRTFTLGCVLYHQNCDEHNGSNIDLYFHRQLPPFSLILMHGVVMLICLIVCCFGITIQSTALDVCSCVHDDFSLGVEFLYDMRKRNEQKTTLQYYVVPVVCCGSTRIAMPCDMHVCVCVCVVCARINMLLNACCHTIEMLLCVFVLNLRTMTCPMHLCTWFVLLWHCHICSMGHNNTLGTILY